MQLKEVTKGSNLDTQVNRVGTAQTSGTQREFGSQNKQDYKPKKRQNYKKNECFNCGFSYPHDGEYPAKGQKYKLCGLVGHFGKMCQKNSKRNLVNSIQSNEGEGPELAFRLKENGSLYMANVNLEVT